MGHTQPPIPIQTDNSMAYGMVTNKIMLNTTKAIDMYFHWLHDCEQNCHNSGIIAAREKQTMLITGPNTTLLHTINLYKQYSSQCQMPGKQEIALLGRTIGGTREESMVTQSHTAEVSTT